MPRPDSEKCELTEAEKRDLIKLIEQGELLPEKFHLIRKATHSNDLFIMVNPSFLKMVVPLRHSPLAPSPPTKPYEHPPNQLNATPDSQNPHFLQFPNVVLVCVLVPR